MDFYVILGLEPGASINEVKRAYRRLARRCHPGINPGDGAAGALFERISEAYQTLHAYMVRLKPEGDLADTMLSSAGREKLALHIESRFPEVIALAGIG